MIFLETLELHNSAMFTITLYTNKLFIPQRDKCIPLSEADRCCGPPRAVTHFQWI